MDLSYNPHAERARRKNRSTTNVNHLTLAPLTTKIPFNDSDDPVVGLAVRDAAFSGGISYLQGKSAPTTPRLLSRTPASPRSRSHHRTASAPRAPVAKSKSTTHLGRSALAGTAAAKKRRAGEQAELGGHGDNDWMLRTAALMSTEAREFKGQAWLVSRQSSTSLTAMQDDQEEAFEREIIQERDLASRHASRRGSHDASSGRGSSFTSRANSNSRGPIGRRSGFVSPLERAEGHGDSYFPDQLMGEHAVQGPDFVNLDEKLEQLGDDSPQDDEAAVRRLVRHGTGERRSWITSLMGLSLFSVDEYDEDSDDSDGESVEESASQAGRSGWAARHFEGVSNAPEEKVPPPQNDSAWGDAAWLLSVASKVLF